jgi:hypothetical protein
MATGVCWQKPKLPESPEEVEERLNELSVGPGSLHGLGGYRSKRPSGPLNQGLAGKCLLRCCRRCRATRQSDRALSMRDRPDRDREPHLSQQAYLVLPHPSLSQAWARLPLRRCGPHSHCFMPRRKQPYSFNFKPALSSRSHGHDNRDHTARINLRLRHRAANGQQRRQQKALHFNLYPPMP